VKDEYGKIYILSNNHVLANSNFAKLGDPILQPGPQDGGKKDIDTIAVLSTYVPIDFSGLNRIDAALAEPLDYHNVLPEIPYLGRVFGITYPRLRSRVMKYGRTTGLTSGFLIAINATIKILIGNSYVLFENQIVIEKDGDKFSDRGDSGSLILDSERRAIGLLFTGSETGVTFANPIYEILSYFSVDII